MNLDEQFAPFAERMERDNLPELAIKTFRYYYERLVEGQTGLISEADIEPVPSLPNADEFAADDEYTTAGENALSKTILLKLNGGLGTSMGLSKAKSLLTIKDGLTFLDIIAKQALHSDIPLVLMNSFNTQEDSLAALKEYPDLWGELPLDFLQNKAPKVVREDFSPAEHPDNPHVEWAPPGHGDIYTALVTSGMLDKLLAAGYKYAFVSNSDNLGAVMDTNILGYFATEELPFMMEVADRTEADKKGGHLAKAADGQLILRESAQCPDEDEKYFQDVSRHKYFNTNNLWLNLPALKKVLDEQDGILGLPMIRNAKTVDPRDKTSTPVYQIETAMGSAIAVFKGAGAVRVSRSRFAPVKKTTDLLAVRSDAYILTDDHRIVQNPAREMGDLVIKLDDNYYKLIDQMEARFPKGAPSLIGCERLTVTGDVLFGGNVTVKGEVTVTNLEAEQMEISDGAILHYPD